MDVVNGLGGCDFLFLADDLGGNAGSESAVGFQLKGGFAHDGFMGKAKVLFIGLADTQNDAIGV